MQPIAGAEAQVRQALDALCGRTVYVHLECIPGGFLRNARLELRQAHLRGAGGYRVALRCAEDAWVRAEDLTHWEQDAEGRLHFLAFADAQERLRHTLEISLTPLPG